MKPQRIYLVSTGNTTRLVRAAHRAQALTHVARSTHAVRVPTQEELVKAVSSGVGVENAGDYEQMTLEESSPQS